MNGSTSRDNTLARWAADLQNDFRARLTWCVQPRENANHAPRPQLSGPSVVKAKAGDKVTCGAAASTDPDGNALTFQWIGCPETATYQKPVAFEAMDAVLTLTVPGDAAGKTLHSILRVTDNGTPPLSRYLRLIVEGMIGRP